MDKEKGILHWLKGLFFQSEKQASNKTKSNKYQYLLVVLAIGIGFMLISNLLFSEEQATDQAVSMANESDSNDEEVFGQHKEKAEPNSITDYENMFENQLKEALDKVVGVADTTVFVNVDATETKVYERNTVTQSQTTKETDANGGERSVSDQSKDEQIVIARSGDSESPIITKVQKPEVRGVLVVAKGADNIHIKQMIVEAVTRVLDVPSHQVSVVPKKSKEES